ncbi:uncharacterized protein PHACADRAFT_23618 [Phanerochaete carnosa HHB-10118-sp]|uniref:HNH nuclease domain-containing protein n=1 Tax=Phanerochaete carnosa (strain HHB-10118-sp) TaxID=650164 RepID=K5WL60_PHACS|nr:uncharacterized protein PHACADRAFT_23618 [Phanerochaete carnosa HHB-10118-sp]EKM60165.1 hypothetical protein PHACADRAFT_23618 [Phanerochaete carnosa HHB-10118-sp]
MWYESSVVVRISLAGGRLRVPYLRLASAGTRTAREAISLAEQEPQRLFNFGVPGSFGPSPTPASINSVFNVYFFLPALGRFEGQRPLISFAAYDSDPILGREQSGVDYPVVIEACYVIDNNKKGFISSTRDCEGRMPDMTRVLVPGEYFYVVTDSDINKTYEVVASLHDWCFPGSIPARWMSAFRSASPKPERYTNVYSTPRMAQTVEGQDRAYLLTRYLEVQHLGEDIPTSSNGLALRKDISLVSDAHSFVLAIRDGVVVWHFWDFSEQLAYIYQNVIVKVPSEVSPELLYARFTLATIKKASF